ncbi:MAG: hypothetical protein JWL76_2126 [Thermoleophilia bacterium]|nr:hypothetical protein [Thermoleophilia bacterium]
MTGIQDEALRAAIAAHQADSTDEPRVLSRYLVIAEYAGIDDTTHMEWSYSDSTPPWTLLGMLAWVKHRVQVLTEQIQQDDD